MSKLFGTDGIRGIAGSELTPDIAFRLGCAVAHVLTDRSERKPCVLIGKDTRISGDMFEMSIASGLCANGADARILGVVPTPAVAYLVRALGADAGIMISASHNPSKYNGIKVFDKNGMKLSDATEETVEEIILADTAPEYAIGGHIGTVCHADSDREIYIEHVKTVFDEVKAKPKNKRKILFDLSNGSSYSTADIIFTKKTAFGYTFDFIANKPDGMNINDKCGSTCLDNLKGQIKSGGYDIGIAFDGDADRCLAVDEQGNTIDGDRIIALFANEMKAVGKLHSDTAVVTCLSNMGFHIMAERSGIKVAVTNVGDRYVLEEMIKSDYNLGGEQSGHIILTDYGTTGDGQVTAAKIITLLAKYDGKPASEIFSVMKKLPQLAINVEVPNSMKAVVMSDEAVVKVTAEVSNTLAGRGRVLLRPSGTEALVRIMLEGENDGELTALGEKIEAAIEDCLKCSRH